MGIFAGTRFVRTRQVKLGSTTFLALLLSVAHIYGCRENHTPFVLEGSTVAWSDGRHFTTTLFEVQVMGQLPAKNKSPFLILAGRGCQQCDANVSIYIHSPSDGPMQEEDKQPRYSFPGKQTYYLDGTPLFESRMFWGRCLPAHEYGVVWFQRGKEEDSTWKPGVYFVEIVGDELHREFLEPLPTIDVTLQRVREGNCQELPGRDMTSEP
jgi:hypothetical protein